MEPQVYIDSASIGSIGVAAACVVAVANTARTIAGVDGLRAAFAASLALAVLRLLIQWPEPASVQQVAIELALTPVNACILFCTATGMNEFGAKARRTRVRGMMPAPGRSVGFLRSWLGR